MHLDNTFAQIIVHYFGNGSTCSQVMIYELADHVQGFLSKHNKPPSRSFHEEMLKNQRRQQEKQALEEQQRMDRQRQKEEEMVRMEGRGRIVFCAQSLNETFCGFFLLGKGNHGCNPKKRRGEARGEEKKGNCQTGVLLGDYSEGRSKHFIIDHISLFCSFIQIYRCVLTKLLQKLPQAIKCPVILVEKP